MEFPDEEKSIDRLSYSDEQKHNVSSSSSDEESMRKSSIVDKR